MNILTRVDTQLFQWCFNKTSPRDYTAIRLVSRTGDGYLYLVLGILLWQFESFHGELFLYTGLLAYALELPLFVLLKRLFKRQRPCDVLQQLRVKITPHDKFSLPSGHTAAAFLMATLLSHYYPSVAVLAYVWASLIGLSRVLLGVHYPGDILAGALLGISISLTSINLLT